MNIDFKNDNEIGVLKIYGTEENRISSITYDSRKVIDGSAFACIAGENEDGHLYIKNAIEQGATVLLGNNEEVLKRTSENYPDCTFLYVSHVRIAVANLSLLFHDFRYKDLYTIGITGTNGKTTVAAYVKSLLNNLGLPAGSIGTTGVWSSKGKLDFQPSTPTTPESSDIHEIFDQLYAAGDKAVAMEVSSIAIEQKRVEGILFDVGVHTNLSPEHIEYHKNFANYKKAKLKLFEQVKTAVVNADDPAMAADILETCEGDILTYSLLSESQADVKATNIMVNDNGSLIDLEVMGETHRVQTPVFGAYNVANLLAAVCVAIDAGYTAGKIVQALSHIENPEGRFELIQEGTAGRKIILDYAHTPVALRSLLSEVHKLSYKRLIVMIAGIGIRDFNKMPKMANAVDGKADSVVVTVDHPGYNDPRDIVDKVYGGFSNRFDENIHPTLTREDGVKKALSLGDEGDIIVLTSGCINGAQIVKGEKIPHSDEVIIHEYFNDLQSVTGHALQEDL
ncbi:UDP-N-acetylmuramoyl-L-alanyl-D-glutamate--2,6-diaminopimelate ligase [Virgibacillus phasianinus]|uniref:UDP-N-acetylmuramoyl-L-alanyl-D-glutamate--2, 6-diaminopimelate ligase n=1 Tax=Virgibacillus phasianinus TaxID=2017483 RepID=A0A220U070_9BACI|nr:UDP-N-acetylmuramoyl-L-alanyl-D-glutamate--2,6-diaminopimelate ligase [Virgibacillus phasianinus]ASK61479.1 UDP-N-acetylmuramoyl-L-alanyl-D-glutamate--2,6-diaminopimelate ligase [Virgibacillus phasianinus]